MPPEQKFYPSTSPEPEKEPEGFLSRISRWFQGDSAPNYSPLPPLPATEPKPVPIYEPIRREPQSEPPPPPATHREPPSSSASRTTPSDSSKVKHVLAVLTLERVLPELDAARKQLEEMKISSDRRIRQLEAERDGLRTEVERARSAEPSPDTAATDRRLQEQLDESRDRIRQLEAERNGLRAEVEGTRSAKSSPTTATDRRLQEDLDETRTRIQQLVAERDQSRAETERALAAQSDLNLRIRQLEATLETQQSSRSAEEVVALETRVQALEEELNATRSRADRERQDAVARVGQLEAERDQMAASLAAREHTLMASLGQIEEVHVQAQRLEEEMARLRDVKGERDQLSSQLAAKEEELLTTSRISARVPELEAELTKWKTRASTPGNPEHRKEASLAAQGAPSPDAARLSDLYQQTISRLTVIQASAELLAMNSRLDASSRDTAKDIRSESQLLSEIIKKFALPGDSRKAE